jgi:hypothetical protein
MEKKIFQDANDVSWLIEKVNEPEGIGEYFWIHVLGDNEKYSGFVGNTLGGTFEQFVEGGYLD